MDQTAQTSPFKALLVEGTSGVGKSTLIDALIRRHVESASARKIRTLTHLAQSHTYGPLAGAEDNGGLTVAANIRHLQQIVGMMEWLEGGVKEQRLPWCFVLIDTLHLTHCVRPGVVRWADVANIDHRLAAIGCKLLLVTASLTEIWKRGIEPRKDSQFMREYARKFGKNHDEIHQYFVREQETIKGLFERSMMLKHQIDSEETAEVVNAAYELWMGSAA